MPTALKASRCRAARATSRMSIISPSGCDGPSASTRVPVPRMARCLVTSTQCFHSLDSYQTAGCLKRYARVDVTYPDGESYEYLPGGPVTVMAHAKYQQIADR